ncbi:MAG: hypothetical protein B7C54_08505 [Acidimicrobiales bacterium mtb01]|nr:glycerophosphodiester phosphodiesterase [Actinomycetota bacterium]TEX45149.1 MAG: hypothetical protein B7C54_08505 [Acidimicrobiales bacterium mtb01]
MGRVCQHGHVQQRLPSRLDPPIGFAHRGARAHADENTIEAFQLALRLGATGLESDVWVTSDGVAVLDHDGLVRRRGRKVPIASVRRSALPIHIPTVAEMIEACPGDHHFSVDIKDPQAIGPFISAIRETSPDLEERTWICHPDWTLVATWRPLTHAKLVDSTRLARIKEGPERRATQLRDAGIEAINMHHTDWSGGLVTLFHRFDRFALAWDVQHDHFLDQILRMGVDGVFSDWVDRMVEALQRQYG